MKIDKVVEFIEKVLTISRIPYTVAVSEHDEETVAIQLDGLKYEMWVDSEVEGYLPFKEVIIPGTYYDPPDHSMREIGDPVDSLSEAMRVLLSDYTEFCIEIANEPPQEFDEE